MSEEDLASLPLRDLKAATICDLRADVFELLLRRRGHSHSESFQFVLEKVFLLLVPYDRLIVYGEVLLDSRSK